MRLEPLPVPEADPGEANEAADDILSGVEFRRPAPTIFERIQDEIGELLGRAFEQLLGTGAGTVLAWAVIAVALGLTLTFLLRLGRSVTPDRAATIAPEMVELSRSPSEWRAEAADREAAGDFKDGMLARYRALVGQLVLDGLLDEIPGRTTGEYRREVADRRPEASAAFDEATTLFERCWYGDEPTGPIERDRFVALDLTLAGARR